MLHILECTKYVKISLVDCDSSGKSAEGMWQKYASNDYILGKLIFILFF